MRFNLINSAWLPVIRSSGAGEWIAPAGLADAENPATALDFPRPDWNAAVTEFLIGLLALALRPADSHAWADIWDAPPTHRALAASLDPFAPLFNLDGDGSLAFQDFASLENAEEKPIAALLIDAPGENALKKNTDLFVKRGGAEALCPAYAAAALITLQTYAPSGGVGYRTSLRGGGPLSVLVSPRASDGGRTSLWTRLWANVPTVGRHDLPEAEPLVTTDWAGALPWLAETKTSEARSAAAVTPDHGSPLLAFFACPRRIRLVFSAAKDERCALGGPPSDVLARGFRTQNYGANYLGWQHPLSPYREDKASGRLPIHPRSGPPCWRDWLGWWGFGENDKSKGYPPEVILAWTRRARLLALGEAVPELAAYGFDMDNAKARQWLDQNIPWIDVTSDDMRANVQAFAEGTTEAASALRFQAKLAIYGQRQKDGYRLPDALPRNALNTLSDALWDHTEATFRSALRELIVSLESGRSARERFLFTLKREALRIFDVAVGMDALADQDPRRLVVARDQLGHAFHTRGKVAKALGIETASAKTREPA